MPERFRRIFLLSVCATLVGCVQTDGRQPRAISADLEEVRLDRSRAEPMSIDGLGASAVDEGGHGTSEGSGAGSEVTPIPSIASAPPVALSGARSEAPRLRANTVDAVVKDAPLPTFIDVVFGQMLEVPYFIGPGVADQTDVVVQMRSSGAMSAESFLELVQSTLETYGVRVVPEDGVFQLVSDQALRARMPQFIRARANLETPDALRPVILFRSLDAVDANEMASWLGQAFSTGNDGNLRVDVNQRMNIVTLIGLPSEVEAATQFIDQMDDLLYAGTDLLRYSPEFRVAENLAEEVTTLLSAEGWQASSNTSVTRTILLIPIEFTNDLFILSKSPAALARARFHLSQLDQPGITGDVPQMFVYDVQNVDAAILASTVNAVLGGGGGPARSQLAGSVSEEGDGSGGSTGASRSPANIAGGVIVDVVSNRLIFTGSASDYNRLRPLLQQLDTAASEVLIQVTIAEITLTDETRLGLEFFVDSIGDENFDAQLESNTGGLGGNGLNVGVFTGNVEIALNALASNNQVNVLSKPKLIARSGGAAQIQVGTDVPVITAQRAAPSQDGDGLTDILQQVEYRKTGVLLSIEPIVFSRNRVDLTVSQEVSTALPTTNSNISSPTISNRTLDTQLSIRDGETIVLGGLIQTDLTEGETGIPLLKDLPVAGNLFRNKSVSQTRTELLVLITAYILRGQDDKQELTNKLVDQLKATTDNTGNLDTLLFGTASAPSNQMPGENAKPSPATSN